VNALHDSLMKAWAAVQAGGEERHAACQLHQADRFGWGVLLDKRSAQLNQEGKSTQTTHRVMMVQ
jgi:hypothetical protein